jgi:hypothetical protein
MWAIYAADLVGKKRSGDVVNPVIEALMKSFRAGVCLEPFRGELVVKTAEFSLY